MRKLEVGDTVYRDYRGELDYRYVIDRITKTKAVSGIGEFKRDYSSDGVVAKKNRERWHVGTYHIETEELKEKWKRKQLLNSIDLIGIDKLPTDTLELILTNLRELTK